MFSNIRTLFQSGASAAKPGDHPEPGHEVLDAGGANAFLAQAVERAAPLPTFGPGSSGHTTRTNRANDELLLAVDHERADSRAVPAAVAPLLFPVGLTAGDGSARLGYEGFVLPVEDGAVPSRYFSDPHSLTLAATVARWRDLLTRRSHGAADLGIGFAGSILPTKLTLLADYFPEAFAVPPPLMAAIDVVIAEQLGLASAAETVLPLFRADPAMTDLYRRIDPGLSPYGMWRLFQILIGRLGMSANVNINFAARRLVRPAAGDAFFDVPLFEELFETDSVVLMRLAEGVVSQPDPIGYEGWRFWRNDLAPINQSIMLYGDPMVGTPEQGQCALSWWFSAFFREVHVASKTRYDHGYAMDMHPSAVIFVHTEETLEGPPLG